MKTPVMTYPIKQIAFAVAGLTLAFSLSPSHASQDKPESVKEIMKLAHKGETSMVKKISEGKGTDAEIKQLVAYYEFMSKQEPAKGSKESWQEKTAALLTATKGLKNNDPDSLQKFKAAVNCKACHKEHKPD